MASTKRKRCTNTRSSSSSRLWRRHRPRPMSMAAMHQVEPHSWFLWVFYKSPLPSSVLAMSPKGPFRRLGFDEVQTEGRKL